MRRPPRKTHACYPCERCHQPVNRFYTSTKPLYCVACAKHLRRLHDRSRIRRKRVTTAIRSNPCREEALVEMAEQVRLMIERDPWYARPEPERRWPDDVA